MMGDIVSLDRGDKSGADGSKEGESVNERNLSKGGHSSFVVVEFKFELEC